MHPQVEALQNGGQVVVGTPGRVLDLMNQGFLSFPGTEYVVLDEADKMLEFGFIDDVKKILAATPDERQTLLFSATFPNELLSLARASTRDPAEVATAAGLATVDAIEQFYLEVTDEDRPRALARLIDRSEKDDVFLVFCDRRTDVDRLFRRLERERFSSKALHGGYDQAARFRVMTAFRTGEVKALLATDVASRGLDVEHVTHVVNFGVPRDAADYTHRIGRTGRAGRKGTAITFVADGDQRRWRSLLSQLTWKIGPLEARGASRSSTTRSERPAREQDEEGRPARRDRGEKRERPASASKSERGERPTRSRRPERSKRSERPARPERDEAPAARPARESRPEKKSGGRSAAGDSGFGAGLG
jgi:superfamily II DNA/RNA helicase